jgi:hypothetical protein
MEELMRETERRKLWVKAGGRCTLCKRYLLEGDLTAVDVFLGEGAHIVGQQATARSPRGLDEGLDADERDLADNILLACPNCHTEIDKERTLEVMTVAELRRRKAAHENEIFHQTSLTTDRRTTVLRVFGTVRGAMTPVSRDDAARAVIFSSDRFPLFLPAYDQQGVEIDLTPVDGEAEGGAAYYAQASAKIDAGLGRIREAVVTGGVTHLSVLAIARLPLLIYLGRHLDDGVGADIYQRHRASDSWQWPTSAAPDMHFEQRSVRPGELGSVEGVLLTNLTGTAHLSELPEGLNDAPAFEIGPTAKRTAEDVMGSAGDLARFEACVRAFFTGLESTHKTVKRLHVFGPLPVSAAITFGRVLKAPALRPTVVLYDRTPEGYTRVMEV